MASAGNNETHSVFHQSQSCAYFFIKMCTIGTGFKTVHSATIHNISVIKSA
jgi:hypothetical protein